MYFTDYQFHKECDHLASKLYAHKRAKLATKGQCNYDRQAKHKPIERYEPPKTTKKTKKATAVAAANDHQYVEALQEISQLTIANNQNPLKKLEIIDKPLTIRQDQESKQVVNTIMGDPT